SSGCTWNDGPFRSGSLLDGERQTPSLAEAEALGLKFQQQLNVSNLEAMRDLPADRILAAQRMTRTLVVIDGYFMPKTFRDVLAPREMIGVPIIANFNRDEERSPLSEATTVAQYEAIARQLYGENAGAFLKLYSVSKDSDVAAMAAKVGVE